MELPYTTGSGQKAFCPEPRLGPAGQGRGCLEERSALDGDQVRQQELMYSIEYTRAQGAMASCDHDRHVYVVDDRHQ